MRIPFKYTGKLNDFRLDYLTGSNIVAWVAAACAFLHFVLTFPEKRQLCGSGRGCLRWPTSRELCCWQRHIVAINLLKPAEFCAGTWTGWNRVWRAIYSWLPRRVLWHSYRRAEHDHPASADEMGHPWHHSRDRSLHALLRGAVPDGRTARHGDEVSVLSLVLLPLTFGYAIFRYRLMDVDLIFKRGVVYTWPPRLSRRVLCCWSSGLPNSSTQNAQ